MNLISTFAEFKEHRNIDRATMMGVLEEVFRNMLQKVYGSDELFDVIVNIEKGDLEIWRNRIVVEDGDVLDPMRQISLSDAKKIDESYEIGEDVAEEVKFEEFPRRAVLAIRQNLAGKIFDIEKNNLYLKYKEKIGELITGEVYQTWKREILVFDDEENELFLPKAEQIPSDFFRKGDTVKAIVRKVEMINNQPKITISRTAPEFLQRLFELEVPEIFDGLITIKKIVRLPGERAKVAVESYDDRVDPVGACVGVKGSRIFSIVKELKGENIDVVNYTTNIQLLIQRALSPAKVTTITINEEEKKAEVHMKSSDISLAIGKGGQNIKLANMLTGYSIDIYRDGVDDDAEDDVDLMEFTDEIEPWIIEQFKAKGLDTTRSVLRFDREELSNRTDLELETIDEVISILKAEFE